MRDNARYFLTRTVSYLAGKQGIRQFPDIGAGLPAAPNTHEIARSIAPESRVVYIDNDPMVLSHARALLASGPQGATAYVDADLRDIAASSPRQPRPWTSPSRSPSCCWPSWTTSPAWTRHGGS